MATIILGIAAIAIIATIAIAILSTTDEKISNKVYGPFIPDSELEIFFRKHAAEYIDSKKEDDMIYGPKGLPYISKISTGWNISKYGRVSKKSRFSKVIQGILDMQIKPKLTDL